MRMNARSIPAFASALLLAAAVGALSGCCKPPLNSPPNRELRNRAVAVNVIVMYDPATGASVDPSNKTIEISEKFKDFVQWSSPDGLVYVTFTKGSPFDSPPKHEKKVLKSGPSKKGTAGHGFDYTAELWLWSDPTGTHPIRIDPRIEIVD